MRKSENRRRDLPGAAARANVTQQHNQRSEDLRGDAAGGIEQHVGYGRGAAWNKRLMELVERGVTGHERDGHERPAEAGTPASRPKSPQD